MIDVTIIARLDPTELRLGAGPTVYSHVDGQTAVLATHNLDAVDPCRIGEVVISLLRAAQAEAGGQS